MGSLGDGGRRCAWRSSRFITLSWIRSNAGAQSTRSVCERRGRPCASHPLPVRRSSRHGIDQPGAGRRPASRCRLDSLPVLPYRSPSPAVSSGSHCMCGSPTTGRSFTSPLPTGVRCESASWSLNRSAPRDSVPLPPAATCSADGRRALGLPDCDGRRGALTVLAGGGPVTLGAPFIELLRRHGVTEIFVVDEPPLRWIVGRDRVVAGVDLIGVDESSIPAGLDSDDGAARPRPGYCRSRRLAWRTEGGM